MDDGRTFNVDVQVVGVVFVMVTLFDFKDLNEKLTVMTASNAAYQVLT